MELHIVPWALEGIELGANVLELGPGYGGSTEALLSRCEHLTCIEPDYKLATYLEARLPATKTTTVRGDASAMQFPGAEFDAAVCFMMLHHVSPESMQNQLFSEAMRVLKPGGVFAGADSPSSLMLSILHIGDKVSMINPMTLTDRLDAAGFENIRVHSNQYAFRFCAYKPRSTSSFGRSTEIVHANNEQSMTLSLA